MLNLNKNISNIVFAAMLSGALAGCSNKPSLSDAERAIRSGIPDCPGLALSDFKNINDIDVGDVGDHIHYKMVVAYNVGYIDKTNICKNREDSQKIKLYYTEKYITSAFYDGTPANNDKINESGIMPIKDAIIMTKTESGWKGNGRSVPRTVRPM